MTPTPTGAGGAPVGGISKLAIVVVIAVVVIAAGSVAGLDAAHLGPFSKPSPSGKSPSPGGSNPGGGSGGSGGGGSGGSGGGGSGGGGSGGGGSGGGGGGGSGGSLSFTQAIAKGEPAANSTSGGPWSLIYAVGGQSPDSATIQTINLTDSLNGTGCNSTILPGVGSTIVIPGTTVDAASGTAPAWILDFQGASTELLVTVLNGVATPTQEVGGGLCTGISSFADLKFMNTTGVENSPTVAAAAWSGGGSSWAANHSKYAVSYIFFAGAENTTTDQKDPSNWTVQQTNCDEASGTNATYSGGAPSQVRVYVNTSTAAVLGSFRESLACPSTFLSSPGSGTSGGGGPGLKGSGSFNTEWELYCVGESSEGSTFVNNGTFLAINGSAPSFTLANITVSIVVNSTGEPIASTSGFVLEYYNNNTDVLLASYSFSTDTWNHPARIVSTGIEFVDYLVLETPGSMAGYSMKVTATASAGFTGYLYGALGPFVI